MLWYTFRPGSGSLSISHSIRYTGYRRHKKQKYARSPGASPRRQNSHEQNLVRTLSPRVGEKNVEGGRRGVYAPKKACGKKIRSQTFELHSSQRDKHGTCIYIFWDSFDFISIRGRTTLLGYFVIVRFFLRDNLMRIISVRGDSTIYGARICYSNISARKERRINYNENPTETGISLPSLFKIRGTSSFDGLNSYRAIKLNEHWTFIILYYLRSHCWNCSVFSRGPSSSSTRKGSRHAILLDLNRRNRV